MEKLIVKQHSDFLDLNIKALVNGSQLLSEMIDAIRAFTNRTGVKIIDVDQNQTAQLFIESISVILPNSDRVRQLQFRASILKDADELSGWTKERLYELHNGKIGALEVTREMFVTSVTTPMDLITTLVECMHQIDTWIYNLPDDRKFWSFINLAKGKVIIAKDAEEKLTEHYTQYATANQARFFDELIKLTESLSDLEQRFKCIGLTPKGLIQMNGRYVFNTELLNQIK